MVWGADWNNPDLPNPKVKCILRKGCFIADRYKVGEVLKDDEYITAKLEFEKQKIDRSGDDLLKDTSLMKRDALIFSTHMLPSPKIPSSTILNTKLSDQGKKQVKPDSQSPNPTANILIGLQTEDSNPKQKSTKDDQKLKETDKEADANQAESRKNTSDKKLRTRPPSNELNNGQPMRKSERLEKRRMIVIENNEGSMREDESAIVSTSSKPKSKTEESENTQSKRKGRAAQKNPQKPEVAPLTSDPNQAIISDKKKQIDQLIKNAQFQLNPQLSQLKNQLNELPRPQTAIKIVNPAEINLTSSTPKDNPQSKGQVINLVNDLKTSKPSQPKKKEGNATQKQNKATASESQSLPSQNIPTTPLKISEKADEKNPRENSQNKKLSQPDTLPSKPQQPSTNTFNPEAKPKAFTKPDTDIQREDISSNNNISSDSEEDEESSQFQSQTSNDPLKKFQSDATSNPNQRKESEAESQFDKPKQNEESRSQSRKKSGKSQKKGGQASKVKSK